MTAHRIDRGTVDNPLMAGDPLRLDVTARTTSGQVGSATIVADLTGVRRLSYALYEMRGDMPANSPAFVLELGAGITVTSAIDGRFSVAMTASHTALWSGRDWHTAKMVDVDGQPFALFDGFVTSTRNLAF